MITLPALLEVAPDMTARIAALETAVKSAQSAGDNAWMLTSAALVLMMTGPGLALFYGGLVRRKDVLSLETAVKSAQSAGDNAWMLTSAALVLMMTGPGLALFYGGLVRRKNVLST